MAPYPGFSPTYNHHETPRAIYTYQLPPNGDASSIASLPLRLAGPASYSLSSGSYPWGLSSRPFRQPRDLRGAAGGDGSSIEMPATINTNTNSNSNSASNITTSSSSSSSPPLPSSCSPPSFTPSSLLAATAAACNMPVGSAVFALTAIAFICLLVLLLLRYFLPLRQTPSYLVVPIFMAVALPGAIVLLVPIDLASSSGTESGDQRGIWLPGGVLIQAWRVCYWFVYFLTWIILPTVQHYSDSGYRSRLGRFLYSLKQNVRFQAGMATLAASVLGYYYLHSGDRTTPFIGLGMALAYCWGLIILIYLLGHGLVALPRYYFRSVSVSGKLRRLQLLAPKIHDRLTDACHELEELEAQVLVLRQRKMGIPSELQPWVDELTEALPPPTRGLGLSSPLMRSPSFRNVETKVPPIITKGYLADLTKFLKQTRHKRIRFIDAWENLVLDASKTQTILDSAASKRLDLAKPTPTSSWWEGATILSPYQRYLYFYRIRPVLRFLMGVLCSLASTAIVWSELVKHWDPNLSAVGLSVVQHVDHEKVRIGFGGQLIAMMWLLYMCAAAMRTINEAKVWGIRALVKRNTYCESACWYASQCAKLAIPLTYNFVTFLPPQVYHGTSFYHFLGKFIRSTKVGAGFDDIFPMLILIPVLATLFNVYSRIKNIFGFGVLDSDDEENESGFGTGGWREGQDLIERELSGHGFNSGGSSSRSSPISRNGRASPGIGTMTPPRGRSSSSASRSSDSRPSSTPRFTRSNTVTGVPLLSSPVRQPLGARRASLARAALEEASIARQRSLEAAAPPPQPSFMQGVAARLKTEPSKWVASVGGTIRSKIGGGARSPTAEDLEQNMGLLGPLTEDPEMEETNRGSLWSQFR